MDRPGVSIEAADCVLHLRPDLLRLFSGEQLTLEVQRHLEPEVIDVLLGCHDTERQSEYLREGDPERVVETDELGPAFDQPPGGEVPQGVDSSADAISRLEDADVES